jgi:hypothetical protein
MHQDWRLTIFRDGWKPQWTREKPEIPSLLAGLLN